MRIKFELEQEYEALVKMWAENETANDVGKLVHREFKGVLLSLLHSDFVRKEILKAARDRLEDELNPKDEEVIA